MTSLLLYMPLAETLAYPGVTGPTIELRIRHKDGSWRYMEAIGQRSEGPFGATYRRSQHEGHYTA